MLEQLRRNSRSFIIWVLFGIIIAAFIFTLGTPSATMSCSGSSDYVMAVAGHEVPASSMRFARQTLSGPSETRTQRSLQVLLERELLAQAADAAGFELDVEMALEHIKRGDVYFFGTKLPEAQKTALFFPDGYLDYDRFRSVVQSWGITVDEFIEEQVRELRATLMRRFISEQTGAAVDEAKARFAHENTTVTLEAVLFRPGPYRTKLDLTEAKIAEYLASHEADVRKSYEQDEALYKNVGEQARIRQIVFQRSQPAEGAAPEGEAPAATAPGDADPKRAVAQSARQRIAGGADFAAVAADVSEDDRSKRRGGDLGWRSIKAPGLGSQALADAVAALEPGEVSEVIETPSGFYIFMVADKRSGDLTFDQVKTEIAERLAGAHYAKESARAAAQTALAQVQAGKTLDELFERQGKPAMDPSQLPPEILQQLTPEQIQQILQPQGQGGEEGSIRLQSRAVPVSSVWQGAEPTPAGDQAAPAPAAAAATGAAPAQPPAATGATAMPIEFTGEVAKPKLQKIGPITRNIDGDLSGLGSSKELLDAAFDTLPVGQVASQVYEVGDNFAVVQVVERSEPDLDTLTEDKQAEMVRDIARERGYYLLSNWLEQRCQSLYEAGEINLNHEALRQYSEWQTTDYNPCASLRAR